MLNGETGNVRVVRAGVLAWLLLLLWFGLLLVTGPAHAAQPLGVKACVDCHPVQANPAVHLLFQTPHGGGGQHDSTVCSGCHGASLDHRQDPLAHLPEIRFGAKGSDPALQNRQCLACHKGGERMAWEGSAHHRDDLNCVSCHQSHVARDPVTRPETQAQVCFTCHKDVQAQSHLPSSHPMANGKTQCSDCHNAHGSATVASLQGITLNDTCYQCHADKRGPFLFEHAPVSEDCSLCHQPHGSVNPSLLTTRVPFLCQQCHSAAFHPSQLMDATGLPGASQNLLGNSCVNCHSEVHGSNHPSGGRLTR